MSYPKWHRRHRQGRVLSSGRRGYKRMSRSIAALYRFFYDGLLSRLPEPAAIALGQSVLRRLPLDRLGSFRLEDPRLAVTLGGVSLPNPLILAAMYYDPRILSRAMGLGFGAVTAESIDQYVRLVRELGPLGDLVEFNISSPNTRLVYEWSRKPGELAALLREVRRATEKPLIVKLSPDFAETNA